MQTTNTIESQRTVLSEIIIHPDDESCLSCEDYMAKLRRSEMQVEEGETVTLTPDQLRAFEF